MRKLWAVLLGCAAALPLWAGCLSAKAIDPPLRTAPLVVFGELHGTRELPALVGDYLCFRADQGEPMTLALELPQEEQALLDAAVAQAEDQRALVEGRFWSRERQDGRSSKAMLALLERVRELREAGATIEVLALDPGGRGSERDAGMAERLRAHRAERPDQAIVALVGNVHARRVPGNPIDPEYRSLAVQLADLAPLTLDVRHGEGGQFWGCLPEACGPQTLPVLAAWATLPPGLRLHPAEDTRSWHHGYWWVQRLSASPPAVSLATAE